MEYEIGLKLYERTRRGAAPPAPPVEALLKDGDVAFPFDGEYWNDELRLYRVRLDSRCIEEAP